MVCVLILNPEILCRVVNRGAQLDFSNLCLDNTMTISITRSLCSLNFHHKFGLLPAETGENLSESRKQTA